MSARRRSGPRPERAGTRANGDLWLRVHLGQADAGRLLEMQTEEETPVDTIRRLIRTAAMVHPILEALRAGQEVAPSALASPPNQVHDLVERQMATMDTWLKDD